MDFNIYFCGNQNTIAMSTYINSMTDFGFKYIFGREESKMEIMPFIQRIDFSADCRQWHPTRI